MDSNSWAARLSSASKRYQSALQSRSGMKWDSFDAEMLMGFEEIEMDDDIRTNIRVLFARENHLKAGSHSTLSFLRRELREGNLQSLFGGSHAYLLSNNAAPDPLLSSFILPMSEDYESVPSHSSAEATLIKKKHNW
ncbi:hypothetical protein DH2020_047226 [Rehmannia glutinosa]|uniref:Di19 C-terminal domain-containing protein n=1 Tax=Rehmannia glutinosa TaxID=99300 RepID=A0ABR0U9S1_REHGL